MASVVEELKYLPLNCIDPGWAESIYEAEFLEFGDLPPEYENAIQCVDLRETFQNIMKSIDRWLRPEREDQSWAILSGLIPHERVLALLAYYIDHGCKHVKNANHRNNALLASRVYFKLLSIPGHKAYHIYHSQLFTNSLTCLGFPKAMCDEDNYFNSRDLTREVNSVIRELRHFVVDLKAIIENLQLTPNDMNFEDILSNLVDVTGGAIVNKLHVDKIEFVNISTVIYSIIHILICDANQQPDAGAIKLLFKCLLSKLIASSIDNRQSLVQASYVTYSGLLLSRYGKAALSNYMILLQHLCYILDNMERGDIRLIRVSLVTGLMTLLPRKSYKKIVQWLIHLSASSRILHRHIAMEILCNLLSNDPEEVNPADGDSQNNETEATTNAENVEQPEPQPSTSQQNVNQPSTSNQNELENSYAVTTDDETSQDSQGLGPDPEHEMTEEDIAGLLRHRRHTVSHAAILRAMYERVEDVSGTLRTRAIVIISECFDSDRPHIHNALQEVEGRGAASRLLAAGARAACDERAVVRRAAAGLVQRLLVRAPPPDPAHLALLANLCRDASIIVRSAAISALNELVTGNPSEAVVDSFLSACMPQLSDPEAKVQQQVALIFQHMLMERLTKFVAPGHDDPLPWSILAGIARNNMRKQLQKACTTLKTLCNTINHRIVDILSTHLGVMDDARDLQCLVLLSCIARLVEYSDVAFVLDYYYRLAENENERDARLMPLILEVLSMWSPFLQSPEHSALRGHLVRRLADARNDGCRIMCASLAALLDPDNLVWATELMQLAQQRAVAGCDVEEALRAADLSLVAPVPPAPALLDMLLAVLAEPPAEWSRRARGASVAGAGRLCLRARAAAERVAPALAALLARPAAALPARLNAVLALADICTRYTCIVEPLLGSICGCLSPQTPAELRRTAARTLTRLLLGGFLRLRTPLYYRYCALLADEDHDVREPAEYYVTSCLTVDSIYHHFVDCVVHYNSDETDKIEFDARQLIYDVMLQRMSLVQKLNIQCRLARNIIDHAADMNDEGYEELPPAMNAALLDTITLLCGPRMKLPKKPQNNGEVADIDDLQERVTTNIVSHKMKRTVAEVLVPAVLRLYSRIGSRGGQLAAYLVRIATDLLNDYRQEIDELFENDDELMTRVQQFQETIGLEPTSGNVRNLVTGTAPAEPDTPHAPRRRARASPSAPPAASPAAPPSAPPSTPPAASPAAQPRRRALRI